MASYNRLSISYARWNSARTGLTLDPYIIAEHDRYIATLVDVTHEVVFVNQILRKPTSTNLAAFESLTRADLTVNTITYSAVDVGAEGNDISIKYQQGTKASKVIQDLTYTADAVGVAGNNISIEYVGGGTAGSETVNVVGSAITVTIQDGVSNANQIKAAVDGNGAASALVDVTVSGVGTNAQSVQGPTNLEGGIDAVTAGNEVVEVTGTDIVITIEDSVSTAGQVVTAVNSDVTASVLVKAATTSPSTVVAVAEASSATDLTGGLGINVPTINDAIAEELIP